MYPYTFSMWHPCPFTHDPCIGLVAPDMEKKRSSMPRLRSRPSSCPDHVCLIFSMSGATSSEVEGETTSHREAGWRGGELAKVGGVHRGLAGARGGGVGGELEELVWLGSGEEDNEEKKQNKGKI
jgi:hypothetical protein